MNYPYTFKELPRGVEQIHYYPSLDSTGTALRRLAEKGAPDGTVVLADYQSAGRGRRGRSWHSPPGKGIYFSALLRPPRIEPLSAATVTLVAALAIARQLRKAAAVPVVVKWPNDLLIGTRKLGGILTEARSGNREIFYLMMGIGLNVNQRINDFPADLRGRATSLYLEKKRAFDRTALFLSVLESVLEDCRHFFKTGFAPFQPLWKEMNATLGRTVELVRAGGVLRGKAFDIDTAGALLIEDERGKHHRIICGEIV